MISPLTGTENVVRLAVASPQEIAMRWLKELKIDVGKAFEEIDQIELWECRDTGLHWYEPAEATGGKQLYTQLEKLDWYYMPNKWEFSVAFDLLKCGSSILEVGIGNGHFLQAAFNKGYAVQGVELNPKSANRTRALGFQVHELTLHDLREHTNERFDAICSFQVLEHVPNPREFLDGMVGLLKPGGK